MYKSQCSQSNLSEIKESRPDACQGETPSFSKHILHIEWIRLRSLRIALKTIKSADSLDTRSAGQLGQIAAK